MKTEELANEISQMQTRLAEMEQELVRKSEGEFEEGNWYVIETVDPWLKRVENIDGLKVYGPSIHLGNGNWLGGGYLHKHRIKSSRPATDDEIKEALVAEAKRRGLVAGKTIITPRSGVKTTPNDKIYKYYRKMDGMEDVLTLNGWLIYYEGNWAEPVEDSVTINGKTLSVESDQIKIDCGDTISKERFEHFWRLVNSYGLDVSHNGEEINKQIDKLAERLEIETNRFTISGTLTMNEHGWTIE